jgi:hypothetical protein
VIDAQSLVFAAAQQLMTRLGQLWLALDMDLPEWIMEIRAEEVQHPEGSPNQEFLATVGGALVLLRQRAWENMNETAKALQADEEKANEGKLSEEENSEHYKRIVKCVEPIAGIILNKRAFKHVLDHDDGVGPESITAATLLHLTLPSELPSRDHHLHPLNIVDDEARERGLTELRE